LVIWTEKPEAAETEAPNAGVSAEEYVGGEPTVTETPGSKVPISFWDVTARETAPLPKS
jgi:hypothetical protein